MGSSYTHLPDEELLLFADGELSSQRVSQINAHLAACWDCRTRLKEIEETITDFVHVHHSTLDPQLPPSAGPRALLKARLTQPAAAVSHTSWLQRFQTFARPGLSVAALLVFIAGLAAMVVVHSSSPAASTHTVDQGKARPVPDGRLTPGLAYPVSAGDVCSVNYSDDTRVVPASVRRRVFQEYGMTGRQSEGYELDYLISPQLGGSDDILNLWPEPASFTIWNMRAKDDLEDRLHQLVCKGTINLVTAQRDLATDWISAYKRYFHTDRPIEPPS